MVNSVWRPARFGRQAEFFFEGPDAAAGYRFHLDIARGNAEIFRQTQQKIFIVTGFVLNGLGGLVYNDPLDVGAVGLPVEIS